MPPTGAVISLDLNCTTVTTTTNTTTAAYDAEGAMKFTVALVLVFGVGVIGMLGFYHQRNLDEDLSNKEADDFVKRFERKRYNMEKQYQKKIMRQLIESFFARTLRVKAQADFQRQDVKSFLRPTLSEPNLQASSVLLADYHDTADNNTDRPPPSHDQPAQLKLPDPVTEARSRSRSFHVPDTRGPGFRRLDLMKKTLLKHKLRGVETGSLVQNPELKVEASANCHGAAASPLLKAWPSGSDMEDSGVDKKDSSCSDLRIEMGGRMLVPTIKVNDVEVR